ncbi:MAG: alanyl-tRNA editing protein [Acetobacteraceae bacterium]
MTEKLFLDDSYLREATATVIAVLPGGILLDRTPFYARGGGQPGDAGTLAWEGGTLAVAEAVKGEDGAILHPVAGEPPPPGATVTAVLDWERRLGHMRMHTTLHLLCSLLPGAAVTGGQVGAAKSRLDFDLPDQPDRERIEAGLAALIAADHPVTTEWVDESVLDTNPGLVRTLSVQPPRGMGRLRLVRIGDVDLQPCGGTHVSATGQIGTVKVLKIENKGRQNRRISLALGA